MSLGEFDVIKKYFNTQSIKRDNVVIGIGDDAAVVNIPRNEQLAITTDTLVAGVHFLENASAYDVGYKSLAVNLSDLAAMGANPVWVTLALTLPEVNEDWLENFSRGFFDLASKYNVQLIGGDITRGPLSISISAYGLVPPFQALTRSRAKPGDLIYVTNTLGNQFPRPEPRIDIGLKLRGIASAAIDISDGLISDLKHILEMSNVGAEVNVDKVPRNKISLELALTAGDDYELCFTAPSQYKKDLTEFTCIGTITENKELILLDDKGQAYQGKIKGYEHFKKIQ